MTGPARKGGMHGDISITGFGLLCAHGDDPEAIWTALENSGEGNPPGLERNRFAPHAVFALPDVDIAARIPKASDRRQMGQLMQTGVYAAGQALEMAAISGEQELLTRTHILAAAGNGERDTDLDNKILAACADAENRQLYVNKSLQDGLRPTLFLGQLPNMFAGNMSIIHGISGGSRTFMGEESAGQQTFEVACKRLSAGQGDIFLAGGAFNAEREDFIAAYRLAGLLAQDESIDDFNPGRGGGMIPGSMGAFAVLERADHARRRGARPLACLRYFSHTYGDPDPASRLRRARAAHERMAPQIDSGRSAVLSALSGVPASRAEQSFLDDITGKGKYLPYRHTAGIIGHGMEASFPAAVILALLCLQRGYLPVEGASSSHRLRHVLVSGWGGKNGEALAMIEATDD